MDSTVIIHGVAPFAGVWIEIIHGRRDYRSIHVAPFAGVWIEIVIPGCKHIGPSVAPFAGVWIEILTMSATLTVTPVAPFAGVWIEIRATILLFSETYPSHPSRVCGLKSAVDMFENKQTLVAPFAGVWIEIEIEEAFENAEYRRTLRGCVD